MLSKHKISQIETCAESIGIHPDALVDRLFKFAKLPREEKVIPIAKPISESDNSHLNTFFKEYLIDNVLMIVAQIQKDGKINFSYNSDLVREKLVNNSEETPRNKLTLNSS